MNNRPLEMIGKIFGMLTVIRRAENTKWRGRRWECVCGCGNIKCFTGSSLRAGTSKSCGCATNRWKGESAKKHGKSKGCSEYYIWRSIRNRCNSENNQHWKDYGGRGIKVCDRWNVFENFLEDMGERLKNGLSIERIDNDGDYEPGNCRWATAKEQGGNRRDNILVNINNRKVCLSEACRILGINRSTVGSRLRRGWDTDKAFNSGV